MKFKSFFPVLLVIVSLLISSWGVVGHRAIGQIAENHLTPAAKTAVTALLGTESLADVSIWADQLRMKEEFKYTTPWHYINLPLGLNHAGFKTRVMGMKDNVYSAMLAQEQILTDKNSSREKKAEALKFIVHFVGDLHQPMHISRAEDQGGNTIQLNYDGKGTNLHSLWDTNLIAHQGLTYQELAAQLDSVPPKAAHRWNRQPLINWLWESYQISSKLYAEVDQMKDRKLNDNYYADHLPVVEIRLQQAGLRLAGLLNELFKNGVADSPAI